MATETLTPITAPSSIEGGATLRDVAARVGVSVQSVSGVLNGGESSTTRVSARTREKIEIAAEELGYRRNHSARAMRTGNTRMLGWLGGKLGEEHVGHMLDGALEAADAYGYTLKILRLDDLGNGHQAIRRASELRLMGMLALHLREDTQLELHTEAQCYGYPLVLMDERSETTDVPQIISDDEVGIAQAVAHLVELGHRRIAFIGGGTGAGVIAAKREAAFHAEMKRHDLVLAPDFVVQGSFSEREESSVAARQLLERPAATRPTAIVCVGDYIALAAMQVARELQIEVPAQLSVIGFANMSFSDFVAPRLTTIEQPFAEIGRRAVHLLLGVIEGSQDNAKSASQNGNGANGSRAPIHYEPLCLPTRLIERDSTAPPPTTP